MVLKFVKSHLQFLGLLYPKANTTCMRNCLVFLSLAIFTIPTFGFFLLEAVSFAEYVNSFFFTSCGLLGISFNAVLLWEKSNLNELILELDGTFKKRRNLSLIFSFQTFFSFVFRRKF